VFGPQQAKKFELKEKRKPETPFSFLFTPFSIGHNLPWKRATILSLAL
jgi:hypothetical protein